MKQRHHPMRNKKLQRNVKLPQHITHPRAMVLQQQLRKVHHQLRVRKHTLLFVVLRCQSIRIEFLHKRMEIGVASTKRDRVFLVVADAEEGSDDLHHALLVGLVGVDAVELGEEFEVLLDFFLPEFFISCSCSRTILTYLMRNFIMRRLLPFLFPILEFIFILPELLIFLFQAFLPDLQFVRRISYLLSTLTILVLLFFFLIAPILLNLFSIFLLFLRVFLRLFNFFLFLSDQFLQLFDFLSELIVGFFFFFFFLFDFLFL